MPVLELVAGEADAGAALAAEAPDTAAETEAAPELPAVEPTVNAPPPSTE
jgi:hypothetical protein